MRLEPKAWLEEIITEFEDTDCIELWNQSHAREWPRGHGTKNGQNDPRFAGALALAVNLSDSHPLLRIELTNSAPFQSPIRLSTAWVSNLRSGLRTLFAPVRKDGFLTHGGSS